MYKYFKEKEIVGLNTGLVEMLDKAREIAGIPFVITSGLRTEEKNKEVGGVNDSSHRKGLAVDLRCRDSRSRFLIIKGLISVGFSRIGAEVDHIHVDIDPEKDVNVIWR